MVVTEPLSHAWRGVKNDEIPSGVRQTAPMHANYQN